MTSEAATGGCLGGAVRYTEVPEPDTAYDCHCRDCQVGSAGAFTVALFCSDQDFALLQGELSANEKIVDSGRTLRRLFCAACGTVAITDPRNDWRSA